MAENFQKPNIDAITTEGKVFQLYKYLYEMADKLNRMFETTQSLSVRSNTTEHSANVNSYTLDVGAEKDCVGIGKKAERYKPLSIGCKTYFENDIYIKAGNGFVNLDDYIKSKSSRT